MKESTEEKVLTASQRKSLVRRRNMRACEKISVN